MILIFDSYHLCWYYRFVTKSAVNSIILLNQRESIQRLLEWPTLLSVKLASPKAERFERWLTAEPRKEINTSTKIADNIMLLGNEVNAFATIISLRYYHCWRIILFKEVNKVIIYGGQKVVRGKNVRFSNVSNAYFSGQIT